MSQPDNKNYMTTDMDIGGCRKFVEAIRSITGNPTMSKLDCEEWIESLNKVNTAYQPSSSNVKKILTMPDTANAR